MWQIDRSSETACNVFYLLTEYCPKSVSRPTPILSAHSPDTAIALSEISRIRLASGPCDFQLWVASRFYLVSSLVQGISMPRVSS
jgi:hypothetical protein